MSSSSGAVGKFSSVASSVKNWSVLGVDILWWFTWCYTSKGGSAQTGLLSGILECHRCWSLGLTGLSSSELLNTKWQHTGLWHQNLWGEHTGCCSAVVGGFVGLKDKSSLVDTLYIPSTLWEELECLSSHSHSHNLHLLVQVLFQRYYLRWSWSDWRVFPLAD